jgi:hypothetical protein
MHRIASLAVVLSLGLSTVAATAMPVAPDPLKDNSAVSQVRYDCGPGMTRGPYGHCRPRFTCPPGWHPGPAGWHCFRNHW